jgi:hypothetical protein
MNTAGLLHVRSGKAILVFLTLSLALWLAPLVISLSAGWVAAQQAGPSGSPAASGFDPQKEFTIVKVEPDVKKEEVRIFFSHPLPFYVLEHNLRLLPRIRIDWKKSSLDEKGVLTLQGDFKFGLGYVIILPDDLWVNGLTYRKTVNTFFLPEGLPKVEYVETRSVIERDSRQLLHVRAQSIQNLIFEGIRVPPLLLPQALAVEKTPAEWDKALETLKAAYAQLRPLVHKQKIPAPLGLEPFLEKQLFPAQGEKELTAVSVPLGFRKGQETGAIELVRVKDAREGSEAQTGPRVFRITDLGLTYKNGENRLLLWVTSLKAGTPVAGATVLAFTEDLEVYLLGNTDQNGVFVFEPKEREGLSLKSLGNFQMVKRMVDKERLRFILAATKDDVTYITFQPQGNVKPSRVWQIEAGEAVQSLKGHIFTERGVYRPGEKVFFKGAVREYRDGHILPPVETPCVFEVINSKGEEVFTQEAKLSEFGTAAGELALQTHWPLGTYTLNMRYGSEEEKAEPPERHDSNEEEENSRSRDLVKPPKNEVSTTFQVQEFKPPRHFVEIDFKRFRRVDKDYVNREIKREFVRIGIAGSYYAGGPVKHGQVRWKVYKSKTDYPVKGFENYIFGYAGEEKGDLIESGQAILNEQGRTELEFPLDSRMLVGQHGFMVVTTVLDFDGRAASTSQSFQADPEILVGISRPPQKIQAGQEQLINIIIVRNGRQIQRGVIQAEVLQEGWAYVAKRNKEGDLYWSDQQVWEKLFTADLPLERGIATFRFDFARGGNYLLAFTYKDGKDRAFTSAMAYKVPHAYYWEEKARQKKPYEPLHLAADRQAYEPGQTARIALSPARPAVRYLVTMERQGIMEYRVVEATEGTRQLEIPIKAQYAPNVYVSILGLTPRGEFPVFAGRYDTEAPGFVWGYLNLPVRREVAGLQVKISPNVQTLKAEPGTEMSLDFTVTAQTGEAVEAEVAVAVVDEGVLALTAFKTPTLDSLTRFDLPLSVHTGELRALLVHQTPFYLSRSEPLTGGGGVKDELVAKLRKRFEAVAYFNPALRTDKQGRARVSFTLPDNLTTYRVYTVVLDRGSRFASSERPLLATKDFYLEPGMPGFFTKGDRFTFKVSAVNTTDATGLLKFSATAGGGLFLTAKEPSAELKAKDSLKLVVSGHAAEAGPASARFGAEFQDKVDAVELGLNINSGFVRETETFFGTLKGASEIRLELPAQVAKTPWDKIGYDDVKAVLTLSGSPFLRVREAIRYLLHYPYGCVEQTSSGVLALAALRGAVKEGLVPNVTLAETDKYLKDGIGRIVSMQTDKGGFAYWPGGRYSHPWGSLYAAAALSVAKIQGVSVSDTALESACKYLEGKMRSQQTTPAFDAFACYVLSLTGALSNDIYERVTREKERFSRSEAILILLAASQANLKPSQELQRELKKLLDAKETQEPGIDEFYARFRNPALILLAAKKILPGDPRTEKAALYLLGGLDRSGIWTSTSDTGWAILALSEYFKGATLSPEQGEATVSQPGAAGHHLTLDPKGFRSLALDAKSLLQNPLVKVEAQPGRTWLYQVELTAPRLDVDEKGAMNGFSVRKSIVNTDGSAEIKVGDLVKVTVLVDVLQRSQRYVVLDDPLPAGLVAINTAFKTEEPVYEGEGSENDFFDYLAPDGTIRFFPNFFEIRSDRVLAFRDQVYSGSYRYEYFARAVCEGEFVLPASKVAAMYSPNINGYTAKGKITIKGR